MPTACHCPWVGPDDTLRTPPLQHVLPTYVACHRYFLLPRYHYRRFTTQHIRYITAPRFTAPPCTHPALPVAGWVRVTPHCYTTPLVALPTTTFYTHLPYCCLHTTHSFTSFYDITVVHTRICTHILCTFVCAILYLTLDTCALCLYLRYIATFIHIPVTFITILPLFICYRITF